MPEPTPRKTHNSLLKQTREAKGLTLDIVHEATKIPMDALKAIEEGYSVRILTPFYYRGFLKIYAEFLGVDPAEVLPQDELQKPRPALPAGRPVVPSSHGYGSTGSTGSPQGGSPLSQARNNEVMEAAGEFLGRALSHKNRKVIIRYAGIVLAVFVVLKIGGCALGVFKKHPVVRSAAPMYPRTKAAGSVAIVKHQMIRAPSDHARVSLAVRAVKDTWVQVKTDGNIVFQMKMKKGTMESWSAGNKIELSGRNVSELDLEVNGDHIGPLGSAERGARKVLITKEGLTVKK